MAADAGADGDSVYLPGADVRPNWDASALSRRYAVRVLTEADVEMIFALCRTQTLFYRYHPPFVTPESILEDLRALPPGKTVADKLFAGFFDGTALAAILDLIWDYPARGTAWLGLFMLDAARQGQGEGTALVGEILQALREAGMSRVRLGVDLGNAHSWAFWTKNGFSQVDTGRYLVLERALGDAAAVE